MASHFTYSVRTGKGSLNFYFNRLQVSKNPCYHVSVVLNNKAVIFYMEHIEDRWRYTSNLEMDWFKELESHLSEIIMAQTSTERKNRKYSSDN